MVISLFIINIFIIYLYYFRKSFIAELLISFVPYIIALCIIVTIIGTYLLIKGLVKNFHITIQTWIIILNIILSIWIGILYSLEYFSFYNQANDNINLTNQKWIKIFYSNIYYKNTDYKSLQQKIDKENPDIVILVEFSDDHEENMKQFFKENYQYMNRNSRSTMLAWDVVFSKIPLKNITETHVVEAWSRNYSYMNIQCENCKKWLDLYVVHTAAPVSFENFKMRNSQLSMVSTDFKKVYTKWQPTIIVGDFNLSPWSYYYKDLTKDWNMLNALSFQTPSYTWSLNRHRIIRSHIDQLFISPDIKISPIRIENLTWSDHRSFTFNVSID